jgi:hypothetical protein
MFFIASSHGQLRGIVGHIDVYYGLCNTMRDTVNCQRNVVCTYIPRVYQGEARQTARQGIQVSMFLVEGLWSLDVYCYQEIVVLLVLRTP